LRFDKEREKELFHWESDWDRTRQLWNVFVNAHSKKKFRPQDLIKLSWDKPKKAKEEKPLTAKDMKEMLGSKFIKDGK
jgi:hypothetical protein